MDTEYPDRPTEPEHMSVAGMLTELTMPTKPPRTRPTTPRRKRRVLAMGACVLGLALVSGCSSGGAAATSTNPGQAPAATTAPAASTTASTSAADSTTPASAPAQSGGSNGAANAVNVCAVFPAAAASKTTGLDLTNAKENALGTGISSCSYTSNGTTAADIESELNITVYASSSSVALDALKVSLDGSASQVAPTVPITGVGGKAYAGADGTIAQGGNDVVQVAGLVFDIKGDHAASGATAKAVLAAIG
ncbi:hypothetical protein [Arthrobacter sp. ERGS1:01]|uniref:hypothetical protein n=1 Tax=Arthrobacter sp. ERGS1:01 TaxID=1704044 RepID=UPI0006B56FF7|nr:hypothetical protein [Arthrobacter sp. ERGS1:01]